MLGVKIQRYHHGGLGIKNNKKGSLLGQKINPLHHKKNSLISYHSNEPKKSNLEK